MDVAARAWKIVWWRHCVFPDAQGRPDPDALVLETDLVDELWRDRKGRRSIRVSCISRCSVSSVDPDRRIHQLGKWMHAWDEPRDEDIMMNPLSYKFSSEIDQVLSPHARVLAALLDDTDHASLTVLRQSYIPSLDYVREAGLRIRGRAHVHSGIIPHLGDTDVEDFGRIVNWIFTKVPGARDNFRKWLVSTPTAHAITLVLKERHKVRFMEDPDYPAAAAKDKQEHFLLQEAWRFQMTHAHKDTMARDVDLECLYLLERRLFSLVRTDVSTYKQWGLDAGDHQDKWYPYQGLPQGWCDEDYDFSDSELLVREQYARVKHALTPV